MKAIRILFLSLFFLQLCSCKDDKLYSRGFWKYSKGFYMGDLLDFKTRHLEVKNDTLFRGNCPVAVVQKIESNIFVKRLYIKDFDSNEIGIYVEK